MQYELTDREADTIARLNRNAKLLEIAERNPAPQEWYDERQDGNMETYFYLLAVSPVVVQTQSDVIVFVSCSTCDVCGGGGTDPNWLWKPKPN